MDIVSEIYQIATEIKNLQEKIESINRKTEEGNQLFEKSVYELFILKAKLQKLENSVYLRMNPSVVGTEIDLYLKNIHNQLEQEPEKFEYIITIHDTKTVVGTIEVRFRLLESEKELGNIGANIKEEYRGKRYSKMAFELLHDTMLAHGLRKPIFTVRPDNYSSIRSLNAIGAKLIDEENDSYYSYEYDLESYKK